MSYIVQTDGLTKTIQGKDLVQDINIHVKKGEIYGFLGPNGAGKTTVMKLITNLWKPSKGTITLFGRPLTAKSYDVYKRMGSIIEFPTFYENLSGRENLKLHCAYMGYHHPNGITSVLELLHIADAADKPVRNYSLGMKQRLGIARAILCKPELLILDEPINGLDPAGIKQIRNLLKTLCTEYGTTMIVSSHILSEVESIADTIGIIAGGKLLQEIPMQEIIEMNAAYIELKTSNLNYTACLLADKLQLTNFKVMDDAAIRIYDKNCSPQQISDLLAQHQIAIHTIYTKADTLEDYFLNLTTEGMPYADFN